MTYENLDYVVRDRVAEITLKRAPVNALNHALVEDINAAYRQARDDAGVRAVILTSAFDNAFSAGMDLAMIRGGSGMDLRRFLEKLYFEMHDLQYRLGKPTIAALTGPARAAGVTLAVSCDVILAADGEPRLPGDRRRGHSRHALCTCRGKSAGTRRSSCCSAGAASPQSRPLSGGSSMPRCRARSSWARRASWRWSSRPSRRW